MNNPNLDLAIHKAIGRIVGHAPAPAPRPHPISAPTPMTAARSTDRPRWILPAAAATVGVVGVGATVLVADHSADAPTSVPVANPPATGAPIPASAGPAGEPATCGTELPVTVSVPGSGPMVVGPADDRPQAAGQFVAHWQTDWGTAEIRWPADPKPLYDPTGELTDSDLGLNYIGHEMAGDGSRLTAKMQTYSVYDGVDVTAEPVDLTLLQLSRAAGEGDAAPPCDVVQVRYLGDDGWHAVTGYFWPDLAEHSPIDLEPLVFAPAGTTGSSVPTVDDVGVCDDERGVQGGTAVGTPSVPTPAEALLAYLTETGLPRSGYREHRIDNSTYVYTFTADNPGADIAVLVTVTATNGEWAVTEQYNAGC